MTRHSPRGSWNELAIPRTSCSIKIWTDKFHMCLTHSRWLINTDWHVGSNSVSSLWVCVDCCQWLFGSLPCVLFMWVCLTRSVLWNVLENDDLSDSTLQLITMTGNYSNSCSGENGRWSTCVSDYIDQSTCVAWQSDGFGKCPRWPENCLLV